MSACPVCACEYFLPVDPTEVPSDCAYHVQGKGICAHCTYEAGFRKWLSGIGRQRRRAEISKRNRIDGKTLKLIKSLENLLITEQDLIARLRLKVEINSLYFGIKRPQKYDTARTALHG